MRLLAYISILTLVFFCQSVQCQNLVQPEQLHISYGVVPSEMRFTWVTFNKTDLSQVKYGPVGLTSVANGTSEVFQDGGSEKRILYIHRVVITGLTPGQTYYYHCGSDLGWSALYWFTAMQSGTNWSPRLGIYGDLGNVNAQSLPRLQEEVQNGNFDAILHVGDFAYNMDTDNARVGDEFMRQLEPIAAYVPYMVTPGNHEQAYNFSNYASRFSMVQQNGQMNNHYYSFNIGPAHIISFSSEFYYFVNYGLMQLAYQYDWIKNDLEEANKPENRALRPWIITMAHRPMYCSTNDTDDCRNKENLIRKGLPVVHWFGLEDMFYDNGVDVELWAHEHTYERMWPLYNRTVFNGSYEQPYTNPKAPIHIITGSSGCQERVDPFIKDPPIWSAFRSSDYGYTRMTIHNATHIYFEQVSDDKGGQVIDKNWIIKEKHGPEAWL